MKIVSIDEMRALEQAAFASGMSEAALQTRAAETVAEEVFELVQPGQRVVVLVGHGNNGRDGALAALWLAKRGVGVDLVLAPRHAVSVDELASLEASGATPVRSEDQASVEHALSGARVAVDALAGIGARGALHEPLASLAHALNAARRTRGKALHVVGLDLPSGIDADTGAVPGQAVVADTTVTLGGVKQGLLRFPAAERTGRLLAREIGLVPGSDAHLPFNCMDEAALAALVPPRPVDAHKYRFGRVLVIAGADHFLGAPVLCAGAAARIGAGLVTVASTRDVRLNVAAHLPEVTFTVEDVRLAEGASAARAVDAYLRTHNAVIVGPGLGRGPTVTEFVHEVLIRRPREHGLVIDADALVALAEIDQWWTLLGPNVVLTPHAGELERLVGGRLGSAEPPWVYARELALRWGCVLLAKGPFSSVAACDGRVDVWPSANAALATAGTGDVLAGVCGGLLAQGLAASDAARLAVGCHALAAERVVGGRHWRTLLASDLLAELPAALESLATQLR